MPTFFKEDLTDALPSYLDGLHKMPVSFHGIYCGYLGSLKQIKLVGSYIKASKEEYNPIVIIDPIMGDHGTCYRTITTEFCNEMRSLLPYSDIITPNITEACILTETDYHPGRYTQAELLTICFKLKELGAAKIIITGIKDEHNFYNFIYQDDNNYTLMDTPIAGESRPGTGDIFASIISALVLRDYNLADAVKVASEFIATCTAETSKLNVPVQEGVALELFLSDLISL
ncbi:MAG: PfkB family carbohydrate kinase [Clostridium sp.]